ncbi:MAG: hypothetical protein J2P19_05425 [Pseudonocardia sp.]|nr:hypothetical protein [Pseudonocardia sp.]
MRKVKPARRAGVDAVIAAFDQFAYRIAHPINIRDAAVRAVAPMRLLEVGTYRRARRFKREDRYADNPAAGRC